MAKNYINILYFSRMDAYVFIIMATKIAERLIFHIEIAKNIFIIIHQG
jgi:hypothetical protein